MWTWASIKPGVASRPPASITRVAGPAIARIWASSPTALKRPSSIATAWARGRAGSAVKTLALTMISCGAAKAPAPAHSNVRVNAAGCLICMTGISGAGYPDHRLARRESPERKTKTYEIARNTRARRAHGAE